VSIVSENSYSRTINEGSPLRTFASLAALGNTMHPVDAVPEPPMSGYARSAKKLMVV
jgi:hypothetical protein